jgi:uncharacterized membrane protein YdjX (TVP38/TMEM64 family)
MKKYRKRLIILALVIIGVVGVYQSGLIDYLTFENLKTFKTDIHNYVDNHPVLSIILFIGVYIVVTGLSLPGATILTLGGGFIFGTLLATLLVNIGATTGATLAFFMARYLLGDWIQERFDEQLKTFNGEIDRYGKNYLLTLRLAPIFPFMWINLFSGLTKIPPATYIWTTAIGILPGSMVYAYTGSQLNTIEKLSDIASPGIITAFFLLSLFAVVPVVIQKVKARKNKVST